MKEKIPGQHPDDQDPRAGIGILHLPASDPITPAAAAHDAEFLMHERGENTMTLEETNKRFERARNLIRKYTVYPEHGTGFAQWWDKTKDKVITKVVNGLSWIWW